MCYKVVLLQISQYHNLDTHMYTYTQTHLNNYTNVLQLYYKGEPELYILDIERENHYGIWNFVFL